MIQCSDNSQAELLQAPVQPTFPVFGLRREVLNQLVELSTGNRADVGISICVTGLPGVLSHHIFHRLVSVNMKWKIICLKEFVSVTLKYTGFKAEKNTF